MENFEDCTKMFFEVSSVLAYRLLDVLTLGLGLPKDVLRRSHKFVGNKGNSSQIRTLYYPPIPPDRYIKTDQARLSEHIDYGTFSFIFQDDTGGLQVQSPDGKFVPVTPIPGTVVVAVGALLQRWTSDFLPGSMHRILMPEDEKQRKRIRQSLVFFMQPDDDCIITCLDGSGKYEPISSRGYVNYKLSNQYL